MSFSSEVKENLSKISNLKNKQEVKYELIGYLISNNIKVKNGKIRYSTVNEYNINRFNKIISNLNILDFKIELKGKTYIITLPKINNIEEIYYIDNNIMIQNIKKDGNLLKSIIRGMFLGGGSVNNPENKYHLEMVFSSMENTELIKKLLEEQEIYTKVLQRKNSYSLYIKDGEEISKFLAFIGSSFGVLKFEEIRVLRDMKNNINRKVNCETANINKTVNAAVRQIDAINKLKKSGEFKNLSENLKEIAILRIENPDVSLIELGQMLKNPIGKSGVNHRLNTLLKLVEDKK